MSENAVWDKVLSISAWYDGPRSGVAEFRGGSYWYRSVYLDSEEWNHDEDRFELTPISAEVLGWELELKDMFDRWDSARRDGSVMWNNDESTFGAFPEEMPRYRELSAKLEAFLARTQPEHFVRGKFDFGSDCVRWELING